MWKYKVFHKILADDLEEFLDRESKKYDELVTVSAIAYYQFTVIFRDWWE